MGLREFHKSGTFVLVLLVLALVGVPFAVEQIGDATDLYKFPVTKTIRGWFAPATTVGGAAASAKPVDWERYRKDLEEFTDWAEGRRAPVISSTRTGAVVITLPPAPKPQRHLWYVPVTSCTAGDSVSGRKGYVFLPGFDRRFEEGTLIESSDDRCGYELAFIGERSVWLRAIFDSETDKPMGRVKLPEFTRVDDGYLVMGNRKYVERDAFPLESGGWLTLDAFLPPNGVVFKLRDESRREVASILCIVIAEKGGK